MCLLCYRQPYFYLENISYRDITFLCQVPVEHQFAMSQVVKHWPKVCGVSVYEIGTSFILKRRKEEG